MTEDQARDEVINYWRHQAREALASARSELSAGRLQFAINRAYYACFYAASAVLLRDKQKFVKHKGVRAAVHKNLVKAGRLGTKWGSVYDRLFEGRHEADYQDLVHLEPEAVTESVEQADLFVAEMEILLAETEDPGNSDRNR